MRSVLEVAEQVGENALGHSPDDRLIEVIGGESPALAANLELGVSVILGVQQVVELAPVVAGNFGVRLQERALRKAEDVRPHRDRRLRPVRCRAR